MDEELQAIVQRMIDANEPEENIATVIQGWSDIPKKAKEVSGQGSQNTSATSTEPSQPSPQLKGYVDEEASIKAFYELNPSGRSGEVVQPAQEAPLTLGESIENSLYNMGTSILGFDDRLSVLSADLYEKVLGKELSKDWYASSDRDIDADRIASYNELTRLGEFIRPTFSVVEGAQRGDISELLGGAFDAVAQLASTAAVSVPTGGAGLFTEVAGGMVVDFNNEKASNLGITVEELYEKGGAELGTPIALGTLATGLEFIGLKGVGKVLMNQVKTNTGKSLLKAGLAWNAEGTTEWLQGGLEAINSTLADPNSTTEQITNSLGDALFSKEGLENYVNGVVGTAGAAGVGKIGRSLTNPKNRQQVEEISTKVEAIEQQLANPETPATTVALLQGEMREATNQIVDILETDTQEVDQLAPEVKNEVETLMTRLETTQAIIQEPSTTEELRSSLQAEAEQVSTQIDNLINNVQTNQDTSEASNSETSTEGVQTEEATSTEGVVNEEAPVQQTEPNSTAEQTETVNEVNDVTVDFTQVEGFTQEDNTRIQTVLNSKEKRTERLAELGSSLSDYWKSQQNLGISTDGRQDAEAFVKATKQLIEYAALTILDGTINTAEQFRDFIKNTSELDIDNDILDNAFNQAQKSVITANVEAQTRTPRTTTKQVIKQNTEGGIKGDVVVSERQALANQIRTFQKGIREGIKQTREANRTKTKQDKYEVRFLQAEINTQINDAKEKGLFKKSVKGNLAERLTRIVNNATTPTQLVKAIDQVERTLNDVEYVQKRDTAKANSTKVRRRARQKAEPKRGGLPQNIKVALRELGSATPLSSELLNEYNTFTGKLLDDINKNKTVDVSAQEVTEIMDKVRKEVTDQRLKNIERYLELRDIDPSGMDAESLNATYQELKEQTEGTTKGKDDVRVALDAVTEILREDLKEFDTDGISDMYTNEIDALQNIDTSRLNNNEVKFLNNAINNLLNNNRVDGVGATITAKHKLFEALDKVNTTKINDSVLKLNNWMKWLVTNLGSTSLTIKSAFGNIREIAPQVRNILGVTELFNNEKVVLREERIFEEGILKLANEHKGLRTAEAQVKISMVAEMMQYDTNLTDAERLEEFNGRKEAVRTSIQRTQERVERDSDFKSRRKKYAEGLQVVWDKYFENANTPEQVLEQLNKGEKEMYDYLLNSFETLKPQMKYITEVYGNSQWKDISNYIPRSYMYMANLKTDAPKYTESSFVAGQSVKGTVAGGANERVLNGSQLPADGFISFDLFNGAVKEYRNQLYDSYTLPTRHYMNQVITNKEFVEMVGDEAIVRIFDNSIQRTVDSQKQYRVKAQSRNVMSAIWRFYNGLGNKLALGGVLSYAKQYAPTFMVTQANMPPKHMDIPLRVMSLAMTQRGDFLDLVAKFPVSERHKNSSGLFFQNVDNLKLDRLSKEIKTSAADRAVRGINWLDEKSDISLKSLTIGDQSSANVSWVSYYISDQLTRGKIKRFEDFDLEKAVANPDEQSVSYAEQMTATTLNTNLGSDGSKFIQSDFKFLPNILIPFASFQINEFINLNTDVNAATSKNVTADERLQAGQRILARVAGLAAINYVGYQIREWFTEAGYGLVAELVGSGDDEDNEKIIAELEKQRKANVEANKENSLGYAMTDLVFGQMSGDIGDDAFKAIETLIASGTGDKKSNVEWQDPFGKLGKLGIPLKTMNNFLTSGRQWIQSDEEWREKSFSVPTAFGDVQVPPEYQDEERPFYTRATMAFSTFAAVPQLFGFSSQEVGSLSRAMQKAVKVAEKEQFGAVKKVTQEQVDDSLRKFSRNEVQYNLSDEELKELKKIQTDILNTPYEFDYKTQKYTTVYQAWRNEFKQAVKKDGTKFTPKEIEGKIRMRVEKYATDDLLVMKEGKLRTQADVDKEEDEK